MASRHLMVQNPFRNADPSRRRLENAPGAFFIDDECISCAACWKIAPGLIASHPVYAFAYFQRQPTTAEEQALAIEALVVCPVGAIGKDPVA